MRTETQSLFSVGLLPNRPMLGAVAFGVVAHLALVCVPFFQRIFKTESLGPRDLAVALVAAPRIIVVAEIWKWWRRRSS